MEITVNGEIRKDIVTPLTVTELLEQLGINPKTVVVECNREIVAKNKMNTAPVQQGDIIEIIRMVGGG